MKKNRKDFITSGDVVGLCGALAVGICLAEFMAFGGDAWLLADLARGVAFIAFGAYMNSK